VRSVFVPLAVSTVLALACGGGGLSPEALEAFRAVAQPSELGTPGPLPPEGRDYDCVLHGGGPSPGIEVPGTCRWDVEADGDGWVVTYSETWHCADFRANVQGYSPCDGEAGSHTWRYRVDDRGRYEQVEAFGNFSPSMAQ